MKRGISTPVWMLLLVVPLFAFDSGAQSDRPWKVQNYISKYRYLAVELNQKTGIPVPIIFAVAGLESDWGTSELALYSNNHFGIKSKDWGGLSYCQYTYEFQNGGMTEIMDCFRKYTLIRESYFDFGLFLQTRENYFYLFRIPQDNLEAWAWGLWYCNYATDPDYGEKLLRLINDYDLKNI